MLNSIQYARALAAFAVVVAHLPGFSWFEPMGLPSVGGFGVDIFFVISGYIMWMTANDMAPGKFAWRRMVRIVPIYWFYTGLLVALALLAPRLTPNIELTAQALFGSFFFVPYRNGDGIVAPLLLQGWTLNYEMFFYLIFGLALAFVPRKARLPALAGVLLLLPALGALLRPTDPILATYSSHMLIEFLFGVVLAVFGGRIRAPAAVYVGVFLLSLVALIAYEVMLPQAWPRGVLAGVPALVLLWSLLGLEDWFKRQPNRFLLGIGDSSYSLYLSHSFVLAGVAAVFAQFNSRIMPVQGLPGALAFGVVALGASLAWAYLSYRFLEQPITSGLNRWKASRAQRREHARVGQN